MQALYQLDVQGGEALALLPQFFTENEPDKQICELALEWAKGTWRNMAACDEIITGSTIKWRLTRLSPVDRAILRLAVFQLKFCPDMPRKVIINEAIELAKKFSTSQAPGFVNGVLDGVLKRMTAENHTASEISADSDIGKAKD